MLSLEVKPQAWTPRLAGADDPNPLLTHVREEVMQHGSPAYRRRLARSASAYARHLGGLAAFESTTALVAFAVLTDYAESCRLTLPEALELLGDAEGEAHEAARWVLEHAQSAGAAIAEVAAG